MQIIYVDSLFKSGPHGEVQQQYSFHSTQALSLMMCQSHYQPEEPRVAKTPPNNAVALLVHAVISVL